VDIGAMLEKGELDLIKLREHQVAYSELSAGLQKVIDDMKEAAMSEDLKMHDRKLLEQAIGAASELRDASNIIAVLIGMLVESPPTDIGANLEKIRSLQAASHLRDVIANSLSGG
jgi:hypothetical protein